MKLLLAANSLGVGGSESYLLTVAEQLDRLGHDTVLYSPESGVGVEVARDRGLAILDGVVLPSDFDAALVQDMSVSYELAARCPQTPQVFVAHSESFNPQSPPQLDGTVSIVIALNDRIAERLRSFAVEAEIVRLRQPIDTEHFVPSGSLPVGPRSALLLSNNNVDDRLAMIKAACEAAGVELIRVGGTAGQTIDPRQALNAVEIVIGYGRAVLEGMACGRAAYVYDWHGGDGWVTEESYPRIEADGFAGRNGTVLDAERLRADLAAYSSSMGPVNHDLVMAHHRANAHAQELVELFRRLTPVAERPAREPLEEMARLVRLEWRARADLHGRVIENVALREQLIESEAKRGKLIENDIAMAEELVATVSRYETSHSWRLTKPLRALQQLLRRG